MRHQNLQTAEWVQRNPEPVPQVAPGRPRLKLRKALGGPHRPEPAQLDLQNLQEERLQGQSRKQLEPTRQRGQVLQRS